MAVALVDGGVGGQAIEIAIAVDVVHPDALGALDDDVERVVVVGAVAVLELDEVLCQPLSLLSVIVCGVLLQNSGRHVDRLTFSKTSDLLRIWLLFHGTSV